MEGSWEPIDIISKIEDCLLECCICTEIPYDNGLDYHNLPCQHSICEECARQIKERDPEQHLQCPTCRVVYDKGLKLEPFRFAADLNELRIGYHIEKEEAIQTYQENRRVGESSSEAMNDTYINILKLDICKQVGQIWGVHLGDWMLYIIGTEPVGFSYLDLLTRSGLRKIGHQDSVYSPTMIFNEGHLYVYNASQQYVEIYKDQTFVTRMRPVAYDQIRRVDVITIGTHLHPFQMGVLVSCPITDDDQSRAVFSIIKIFPTNDCDSIKLHHRLIIKQLLVQTDFSDNTGIERKRLVGRYLNRNEVLCVYRQSLWFVDKRDRHLMEIPFSNVDDRAQEVNLKEPIRHFKISHYLMVCGCRHSIIFMTERSNKIQKLDLTGLASLTELRIRRNKVLYTHAQTPEPVPLFEAPTARCQYMTASENGQVALVDQDGLLHVYQMFPEMVPVTIIVIEKRQQTASIPDYVTIYQRVKKLMKHSTLLQMTLFQLFRFLMTPVDFILYLLLLTFLINYTICPLSYPYEYVSDTLARSCLGHMTDPMSIGFKYLHLSLCLESPALEPMTPCEFGNMSYFLVEDVEYVNMMYIDGPKCFYPDVSNGLRTITQDIYRGEIYRFLDTDEP